MATSIFPHAHRLIAACLVFILTACGGGGDDGAQADAQPVAGYLVWMNRAGTVEGSAFTSNCAATKKMLATWDGNHGITVDCAATEPTFATPWAAGADIGVAGVDLTRVIVRSPGQVECRTVTDWLSGAAYVYAGCRAV